MKVTRFRKSILVLLVANGVAINSAALTIDVNKYFAYVKLPGNRATLPSWILLSKKKCEAQGAGPEFKKAVYTGRNVANDPYERTACWAREPSKGILVCSSAGEHGALGTWCDVVSESKFIDTATLPREANFSD